MTLELYKAAFKPDRLPNGHPSGAALGSTIIITNTNGELATGNPSDPWAAWSGVSTNHGNIRPIAVAPDFSELDLMAIWSDALMPLVPGPTVRVYGRVPRFGTPRQWPEDDDAAFFADVGEQGEHFFIPLLASGSSLHPETLDVAVGNCSYLQTPTNGDTFAVGLPSTFPTRGCDAVIVTVATAGDFDETSSSSSSGGEDIQSNRMLIGARLVG
jgi:hypothetical protein